MDLEENTEPVVQVNEGKMEEAIIEEHAEEEVRQIQADETIEQKPLDDQNPTTHVETNSLLPAQLDSSKLQPSEHLAQQNKDADERQPDNDEYEIHLKMSPREVTDSSKHLQAPTANLQPTQPENIPVPTQQHLENHVQNSHPQTQQNQPINLIDQLQKVDVSAQSIPPEQPLAPNPTENLVSISQGQNLQSISQDQYPKPIPKSDHNISFPQLQKPVIAPQSEYLMSIEQIERILQHKELSQEPFLNSILKNFSSFVFNSFSQQDYDEVEFDNEIDLNFFDLNFLQKYEKDPEIQNLIQFNSIFHCRIAHILYCLTHEDRHIEKGLRLSFAGDLQELKNQFLKVKLRTSFNCQIWTQRRQFEYSYSYSSFKNKSEAKVPQKQELYIGELVDSEVFAKIEKFLIKLGFNDQNHQFNKKMSHLTKDEYKTMYIEEFAFYSFKNAQSVGKFLQKNQKCNRFNNIKFYYNQQKASYNRLDVGQIHEGKATDYSWLERTHDYIQWLFPNHFQSNFNGDSYALGYVEAQIFKNDEEILKKLLTSFVIYLNFMGCKISKQADFIEVDLINRNQDSIQRLRDCIVYNTHNHLRIMRILACLSITGLRTYAEAFLAFLNLVGTMNVIDFKRIEHPLETMWNLYSSKDANKKKKALQMCFLPYEDFPLVQNSQNLFSSAKNINQKLGMNLDQSQKNILLNTNDGNGENLAKWGYNFIENNIISFLNFMFDLG